MTISDLYRFWLDIPGQGRIRIYPMNAELKWTDSRKKQYRFYQRTLETSLVLMDIPKDGINDFTRLMDLERADKTCTRVDVYIDRYCDCTDTWTDEWYTGYLRLSDGEWDVSNCTVTIPVVINDDYTCITREWEKDFNIFDIGGDPVEVSPYYGVIQYEMCEYSHNEIIWGNPTAEEIFNTAQQYAQQNQADDCVDTAEGWAIQRRAWKSQNRKFNSPPHVLLQMQVRYYWVREFSADVAEPPGGGWIAVTGGWARPVPVTQGQWVDHTTPEGFNALVEEFQTYYISIGSIQDNAVAGVDGNGNSLLNNGRSLNTIIENWLEQCEIPVVSNFFGINPDGTNPANSYYDAAITDAQALVLYQVTDVARIDETQSATKGVTTFKKLLNALKVAFNIDIEIDSGVMRIEHVSYWQRDVNMDLTQPEFLKWIEGRWKYSYDAAKLPKRELFYWGVETDHKGGAFDGWPIEYDNDCVNDVDNPIEESFRADGYLTNVAHVVNNEDFFDSELILIVSTYNGLVNFVTINITITINLPPIGNIPGVNQTITVPKTFMNGNLGFRKLHENYHDYGRPFKTGFINQSQTDMVRSLRQRQQDEFTIPMQCSDYMTSWSPAGLVRTQMGGGEVQKATYTDPQGTLTLSLKHK